MVREQSLVAIDLPRRPAHFDRFDHAGPQPEMEPRIARRLIAAPADPLGHPTPPARSDRHPRTHAVPIRLRALQAEPDEMTRPFSVRLCK